MGTAGAVTAKIEIRQEATANYDPPTVNELQSLVYQMDAILNAIKSV